MQVVKIGVSFGQLKDSMLYTIAEGASKGGFHLLLLLIAIFIESEIYLLLILLLGLEALFKLLFVSFFGNVLYKLIDLFSSRNIFTSVLLLSFLQFVLYSLLIVIFREQLSRYYGYYKYIVFIIICANAFISNLFVYYSTLLQLRGLHSSAIKSRSIPFFLSFVTALIGFSLIDDKVLGFFLGKFLGFLGFFLVFFVKKLVFNFKMFLALGPIINAMGIRTLYSFMVAFLGWLSSLGFMYIAKIWSSNQDLVKLGYIITFYNVLFLFGYGINQVYSPKIKSLITTSGIHAAFKIKTKTLNVFILISAVLLIFVFVGNLIFPYVSIFYDNFQNLDDILSVGYLSVFIFMANALNWIVTPFFFSLDRFKYYFILVSIGYVFAFISYFLSINMFMLDVGLGYVVFYFVKNLFPFIGLTKIRDFGKQ